jgi:GWxTD domain-containing protein
MATISRTRTIACFLQVLFVTLSMSASVPAQTLGDEQLAPGNKPSHFLPAEYQRWLDHEVLWIISPDERAAFVRLSAHTERDQFVEQFWQRRNPSPSSAKNEFKEEHYRRLAYANQHFAYSVPGGETDRGRAYIVYGPPTASRHGSMRDISGSTEPTELWHYNSIPGFGENLNLRFVDLCGCGDYRLETPLKN